MERFCCGGQKSQSDTIPAPKLRISYIHRQKEVCLSILGHEVMRSDIDEVYTATLYNKMETT
jgi:hypothetical protein